MVRFGDYSPCSFARLHLPQRIKLPFGRVPVSRHCGVLVSLPPRSSGEKPQSYPLIPGSWTIIRLIPFAKCKENTG